MRVKKGQMIKVKLNLRECDHSRGGCYLGEAKRGECPSVVNEMAEWKGKEVKVNKTKGKEVWVTISGCTWHEDMFEPIMKMRYKIIMTKDKEELVEEIR